MKYGKMKGGVTAKGHEGWIEIQSAQLGVHRHLTSATGRGTNREASVPAVSEIVITKNQDSASNDLFRDSLWGEGADVEIHFLNSDDPINPYLSLKLRRALVSSYSVSGAGGDLRSRPMESLALNFTGIEYSIGGTKNTQKQPPPPQMLQREAGVLRGN
jgi:type VI secretion system secreted protein Hcp